MMWAWTRRPCEGRSVARGGRLAWTLIASALTAAAATAGLPGNGEDPALTPQQWREDLRFYARELPKRHADAFHFTTREEFEAAVAALDRTLDHTDFDHF